MGLASELRAAVSAVNESDRQLARLVGQHITDAAKGLQELRGALEARLSEISSEDEAEKATEGILSEALCEIFHQALETGSLYWSHECATSAWIDCEEVASQVPDESLRELLPVDSAIPAPLPI